MSRVEDGADDQTSAGRKTSHPKARTSIVPARASSEADCAPRSRYLRAGTAILPAKSTENSTLPLDCNLFHQTFKHLRAHAKGSLHGSLPL